MSLLDMLMVGLGGFIGAVTRYFIATKMNESGRFPSGTLLVNLAGSLLIGIVFGSELSRIWTLFLASGLAGALTTFSTLNKEIIELWRSDKNTKGSDVCSFNVLWWDYISDAWLFIHFEFRINDTRVV